MQLYEREYSRLVSRALAQPLRPCRNGYTRSFFPGYLTVHLGDGYIPLLQGRKLFYKGILGEFAAFIRGPKTLADFEQWGCNYWSKWANKDGSIELDYGNAWLSQLPHLFESLQNNPTDRRMLITGWLPNRLAELSLPCCHYAYQFYVRVGSHGRKYLDMLWHQRSTDLMIGLPSDVLLAYCWLTALCSQFPQYEVGSIHMTLGDCHVYEEHESSALVYTSRVFSECRKSVMDQMPKPTAKLVAEGKAITEFDPRDLVLLNYIHLSKLDFEVKA